MKGKRVLSLALAALMTLSLLVVPAAAVSFTDMTNHWAKDDVEYLATQGVVKGTSATTFAPDQKMTACEALLFCSRAAGVDAIDKEAIAEDWEDELKEILPEEMYAWAAQEMAVCLETGIISETELRALSSAGGLVKSITRETLAMYLVRAMQLAPLAQSLTSYPMSFADTTSISASLQPYVYLLNMYGIVKGNELNRFLPQNSLTRAEMATMLRRAIDFMDERGIYAELPGYTDYDWVGGTIAAVSTGSSGVTLLTLTSVVSGTRSISLPADAEIYENNMLSSADALKVGSYARVNLDRKGTAESVRLGGAVISLYRLRHRRGAGQPDRDGQRRLQTAGHRPLYRGAGGQDRRRLHPAGSPGRIHHGHLLCGRHGPSGRGAALRRHPRRGGHTGEGGKRHRRPAAPGVGL